MSFNSNGTWCIRVYYQDSANIIRELCKDGTRPWVPGASFPAAIQGTSIACANLTVTTLATWIYFQKPDTHFVEYYRQGPGGWKLGKLFGLRKNPSLDTFAKIFASLQKAASSQTSCMILVPPFPSPCTANTVTVSSPSTVITSFA